MLCSEYPSNLSLGLIQGHLSHLQFNDWCMMETDDHDSVSQVSAKSSASASSLLTRRRAELTAQLALSNELLELELEETKLKHQRQIVEQRIQLAALSEEQKALESTPHLYQRVDEDIYVRQPSAEVMPPGDVHLGQQAVNEHGAVEGTVQSPYMTVDSSNTNADLINALRLPSTQLIPFDGDPLKFWSFVRSFENSVENCTSDNAARLTRLITYCTGKARKAIECCAVMGPSEGFPRAKAILKQRFGNNYLIAEAWIKRVTTGKPIGPTDKERLQDFADELSSCIETLTVLNYSSELNNQSNMLKIAEQLPFFLQARVKRELCKAREGGVAPNIGDLARLVREAANEANDPVYGKLATQAVKIPANKGQMTRVSTSTVTAVPSQHRQQPESCLMCGNAHTLFGCPQFKAASIDGRIEFAKQNKLCFNCLFPGHMSSNCSLARRCTVNGCGRRHTKFLHVVNRPPSTARQSTDGASRVPAANSVISGVSNVTGAGGQVNALPVVPVLVRNPDTLEEMHSYALLDSGSTNSFCSSAVAKTLNLNGCSEMMMLSTLGNEHNVVSTTIVNLEVCNLDKSVILGLPEVFTKDSLPINLSNRARLQDIRSWPHLKDIVLPEVSVDDVGLLIGQDCPEALVPEEIRRGEAGSPYAVKTALGWMVNGPLRRHMGRNIVSNFVQSELQQQVERFLRMEAVDDQLDHGSALSLSVNDRKALKIWNDTIRHDSGHYSLDIPFKKQPPDLPNNLPVAKQRLECLRRRLSRDESLHKSYTASMNELFDKGYAEAAPDGDAAPVEGSMWYLPHHPVFNKNKPDKIRVVFDCAATFQGTSLNSEVLQGPDLTNKLIGVLLRFREERVAVMADVEAMFHQVRVNEHHRDYLRFLWWQDGLLNDQPCVFRMNVHLFGGVWSPSCCNFVLKFTAKEHQSEYTEEVVRSVNDSFYVDDLLESFATVNQATEMTYQLSSLLSKGGFKLTKWISNSDEVISVIPESERSDKACYSYLPSGSISERALGVKWDISSDSFSFSAIDTAKPATRRGILSVVSSLFDPLGLVSPFIFPAKRLLQELCRKNVGWDDRVPEPELRSWQAWCEDHIKLQNIRIDRCIKPHDFEGPATLQLHHFCDASQDGYGTASYVRAVDAQGRVSCRLLMAKSRLAPMKPMTIPRLELQAATLAVKMDKLICGELKLTLQQSLFWTDSTIVLQYINNDNKRFHTFVANRIAVIRDRTCPLQWRYVDSASNPADDVSRGLKVDDLINCTRWFHGPEFLKHDETRWPENPVTMKELSDADPEVRRDSIVYAASVSEVTPTGDPIDRLFSHYSDWARLKMAVAWLLRARVWLRDKSRGNCQSVSRQSVSVCELAEAEVQILKIVQQRSFSKEFVELEECSDNDKCQKPRKAGCIAKSSQLYRLEPVKLSDGLLHVGGRLQTHQIILPRRHPVVALIVRYFHQMSCHSGREHVLSLLRQHYWIISCRSVVRRVVSDCMFCKRNLSVKPLGQRMADLPDDRTTPGEPPFTHTGVDVFGPFLVKRGRCELKRYGCLFTCLTIRAIHIEVLYSLETDSFLQAFQRFICRRGQVKVIRSDNGTNFVGAAKEIEKYLRCKNIEWKFNPPAASHMGGVWERMIRSVRRVLTVLLREQTLDDERLVTFMCIVESVVNSRPITTVSDDPRDQEALTPNHLLLLQGNVDLPFECSERDVYSRKRWRQVQYLADVFWRRWLHEYLPTLQLRQKWHKPVKNLEVGDVVILADDKLSRSSWPLGRVVETYPGSDGLIRSAKVTTKSVTGTNMLIRPVHKLCLLESVTA